MSAVACYSHGKLDFLCVERAFWIGFNVLPPLEFFLVDHDDAIVFVAVPFVFLLGIALLLTVVTLGLAFFAAFADDDSAAVLGMGSVVLGWTVFYAGSQLIAQAAQLQNLLVVQGNRLLAMARANGMNTGNLDPSHIVDYAVGSVGRVTAAVGSVIGGITSIALIFVLGVFIAIEPRLYERGFAWFLPIRERAHFYDAADAMGYTLRRLMAGRLLGMLTEGVATWILLAVNGIPLAPLLGIITGLLVFIPNIGAIISGVLMVLVGFSVSANAGLYALAVYAVVQTVDGNIIVPMIARRTVDLPPALVLGAQLLFGALFGILGLALADPMVAIIKVFFEKQASRGGRGDALVAAAPAEAKARAAKEARPPNRPVRRSTPKTAPRKPPPA